MSTQSIYSRSISTISKDAEEELLKQSKNYLLKKRFLLGEGVDKIKRNHSLMVSKITCSENCEILQHLGMELNRY